MCTSKNNGIHFSNILTQIIFKLIKNKTIICHFFYITAKIWKCHTFNFHFFKKAMNDFWINALFDSKWGSTH